MLRTCRGFAVLALVTTCIPTDIDAQQSPGQSLSELLSRVDNTLDAARRGTKSFSDEAREKEGTCAGMYRSLPSGRLFVPEEIQDEVEQLHRYLDARRIALLSDEERLAREVSDYKGQIDREAGRLQNLQLQVVSETQRLDAIQRNEAAAVRSYLLDNYGSRTSVIRLEGQQETLVVVHTLFGNFYTEYPRELSPKQPDLLRVTFSSSSFSGDIFGSNISVGPTGYSGDPGRDLGLLPSNLSSTGQPFTLGQLVPVPSGNPLTWTWNMRASPSFKGANFDINMKAGESNQFLPLSMKVQIHKRDDPSFLERYSGYFGGLFTGWVSALMAWLLRWLVQWWRKRRGQRLIVQP